MEGRLLLYHADKQLQSENINMSTKTCSEKLKINRIRKFKIVFFFILDFFACFFK